jgi:hypothetical protein
LEQEEQWQKEEMSAATEADCEKEREENYCP